MENKAFEAAINALDETIQMPMADRKGQSPGIAYLDKLMKPHFALQVVHLDVTYLPGYQHLMNSTMLELTVE